MSNMSNSLPCTLQLEIELVEMSRNIGETPKFHNPLLVLELWIVLAFFSQESLHGIKTADKLLQNRILAT